ncbi:MAG: nicotinate-nucleotide adenylyltransferase [Desulfonatronovibrionaceae bacterium]
MNSLGVIHGRFQVLHNDHLKYLLAGKKLCRHLIIGITNPDPILTTEVQVDVKRSSALANPLTYYERLLLVRESLLEAGTGLEEMTIVPFPITRPELYEYYVPKKAVFFLSIYDDWGRKKLDQFRDLGLKTHVLWEVPPEEKGLSSTIIRELMVQGKPWDHLVPEPVARLCRQWEIPSRLKNLS